MHLLLSTNFTAGTAVNGLTFGAPYSDYQWVDIGGCTGTESTLYSMTCRNGKQMIRNIIYRSAGVICSYPSKCVCTCILINNHDICKTIKTLASG